MTLEREGAYLIAFVTLGLIGGTAWYALATGRALGQRLALRLLRNRV